MLLLLDCWVVGMYCWGIAGIGDMFVGLADWIETLDLGWKSLESVRRIPLLERYIK